MLFPSGSSLLVATSMPTSRELTPDTVLIVTVGEYDPKGEAGSQMQLRCAAWNFLFMTAPLPRPATEEHAEHQYLPELAEIEYQIHQSDAGNFVDDPLDESRIDWESLEPFASGVFQLPENEDGSKTEPEPILGNCWATAGYRINASGVEITVNAVGSDGIDIGILTGDPTLRCFFWLPGQQEPNEVTVEDH